MFLLIGHSVRNSSVTSVWTICSKIILLYITKSRIYIEIHYSEPCVEQCKLINTIEFSILMSTKMRNAKHGQVGLVGVRSSRNAISVGRIRRFRKRRSLHNSGDRCGGLRSRRYKISSGLRRSGRHLFWRFEDVAHYGIVARASLVVSNWSGNGGVVQVALVSNKMERHSTLC